MSDLQRFGFGALDVRVEVDDQGEPWFLLADVCEALGIQATGRISSRIPDDEKGMRKTHTPGGPQDMTVVNEPGLYRLIFRSNKPAAERFRRWVFHEVLPEIRRTGSYHGAKGHGGAPEVATDTPPLVAREVRYPDGRVVVEHFAAEPASPALPRLPAPPDVLPVEEIVVEVPAEELRLRFHRAVREELRQRPDFARLKTREERADYCHRLNGELKKTIGRKRQDWTPLDYYTAVYWLQLYYDMEIEWILQREVV